MAEGIALRADAEPLPHENVGRVLVVDDYEDARDFCVHVLREAGFQVSDASGAIGALELLREAPFDVLITDLVMPDQNGLSLMYEARQHDPHLEVIILTGHATIQTAKAAIREGAFEYLPKPYDSDGLQQAVLQAARQSQVRRRNAELGELFALAELGQSLSATLDLDVLGAQVLDAVWPLFSPTSATLFVVDEGKLELVGARGISLPLGRNDFPATSVLWEALKQHAPWLLPDERATTFNDPMLGRADSAALIPLSVNEQSQPVGLLVLLRNAGRPYNHTDTRRLQLLALPVATALENARRFRQRQAEVMRRRRDMATLHKIAAMASQGLDAEQLLEEALPVIWSAVGLQSGALALLDSQTQELRRRGGGRPDPQAEHALRRDEPILISNRGHSVAVAYAAIPLRASDIPLGVLELWASKPHHFTLDEELLLSSIAAQLSLALQNSRLLSAERGYNDSIRQRNRELAAWKRVAAVVAETLELQPMLHHALEAVLEVVSAPVGLIYLTDEQALHYTVGAVAGLEVTLKDLAEVPPATESWLRGAVVKRRARMEERQDDVPLRGLPVPEPPGQWLRACIAVPLEAPTQIVGVLYLATDDDTSSFSPNDAELLQAIGRQIGLAIQNAYRYEQTRRDLFVKEALLREAHHRIKNNLQTISSLLVLEESYAQEPAAREVLRTVRLRLRSIAAVHRTLSFSEVEEISLHGLVNRIAVSILASLLGDPPSVALIVEGADVMVDSRQATTLAIIINELLTNAVKYDLRRSSVSTITLNSWRNTERDAAVIQLRDSGSCWPEDFDLDRDAGLGLTIVQSLVLDELGGRFTLEEGRWPTIWLPMGANKPGTGSLADSPVAALIRSRRLSDIKSS